jgi:hypothetical protein
MTGEVITNKTPMETFKQTVMEKLKTDIGSLMPEDALKDLVAQAIKETFFTPRIVEEQSGWQTKKIEKPGWFVEAVTDAIKPMLQKIIQENVDEYKAMIEQHVLSALEKDKITILLNAQLIKAMQDNTYGVISTMIQQLRTNGVI